MKPWSSNSCKEFLSIFLSFKFNRYGALACGAEPDSNSIWWSTSRRGGRPFGNLLVRTSLNFSKISGTRPQLGPILGLLPYFSQDLWKDASGRRNNQILP